MADQKRNQRLGMLNAIAEGGKAGGDAYQQAIANTGVQRQQALSSAADRAGAINAPEAFLKRQAGLVAQPADTAIPVLNTARTALNQYMGSMNSAQGDYMAGVGDSRNLLNSLAQRAAEKADAKAQSDATEMYEKLLSKARTEKDRADTANNKDQKNRHEQWKREAYDGKGLSGDERDTVRGLIERNAGLAGALGDLEDAGAADLPPEVRQRIEDNLLKYYQPDLWGQRNSVGTPNLLAGGGGGLPARPTVGLGGGGGGVGAN